MLDMVHSMMSQTTLPRSFWDYALESVACILNMVKLSYLKDTKGNDSLITQEASGSLEDLEVIQEEDTHPSKNTSLHRDEDEQEIFEPQSDVNLVRRSTRTRHAPDRMCLYVDAEKHELGDHNEPTNFKVVLPDLKYEKWLEAMNVEMQSMKDNQFWDIVDLPPNGKTVGSEWLFKKNTKMDGNVHTYKALLIEKGFTQTYRVDHEEAFSPLKQASRQLNKRFDEEIRNFGFTQNHDDPCVYVKASRSKCFAMKDLGEASYILGIKIYKHRSRRLIGLCQSAYIEKILKRLNMENSKRRNVPMQKKARLSKTQGASTPVEVKRMQRVPYTLTVGFIMYAVRCTRPNVAFPQNITSRFQQNPEELHWTVVKNILKYLRDTKDMFLVYGGDIKWDLRVTLYTDDGCLTDADDLKSQTGYVFILNGGALD
ncbi:retrotransposon protein, putative, ty1-copia subclass [Tanacetum coccineum]